MFAEVILALAIRGATSTLTTSIGNQDIEVSEVVDYFQLDTMILRAGTKSCRSWRSISHFEHLKYISHLDTIITRWSNAYQITCALPLSKALSSARFKSVSPWPHEEFDCTVYWAGLNVCRTLALAMSYSNVDGKWWQKLVEMLTRREAWCQNHNVKIEFKLCLSTSAHDARLKFFSHEVRKDSWLTMSW